MADIVSPQPRLSSPPWSLYQAQHLAGLASRGTGEGFYGHMLIDDLRKQRYAYEISFAPDGLGMSRASELMFALLNDFNHAGYTHDPANLVCDLLAELLQESSNGKAMLLELHSLPSDLNRARRRARVKEAADEVDLGLPSLGLIPRWSVKEARAGFSQTSPLEDQRAITIPGTRVHHLELSRRVSRSWTQAVNGLRLVDTTKLIDAGVQRRSWEGYSFSEVLTAQNLAIASSTAEIGWDGRGTFAEMATSPYMTFRRLRFTKFWVDALQESIIFLNRFTTSESLFGQEAFSFSLAGLPAAADLGRAMDNIRDGALTVDEAQSTYLFPKYSKPTSGPTD